MNHLKTLFINILGFLIGLFLGGIWLDKNIDDYYEKQAESDKNKLN